MNKAIKKLFPKCNIYGADTVEGYKRPCFFTKLMPTGIKPENNNSVHYNATFYIDYIQKDADELDSLNVADKITTFFSKKAKINERYANVTDASADWIGNDHNILEISIDLEWISNIERKTDAPQMEHFFITEKEEQ